MFDVGLIQKPGTLAGIRFDENLQSRLIQAAKIARRDGNAAFSGECFPRDPDNQR